MLAAAALALIVFAAAPRSSSQSSNPAYVVTYIEVVPSSAPAAAQVLRDYGSAGQREDGSIAFSALQQIGRDNHFAILQVWKDPDAQRAHASSGAANQFRSRLQPMLIAPFDERLHSPMATSTPQRSSYDGGVVVITHVDFEPESQTAGSRLVASICSESRLRPGNRRFDALTEIAKPNHKSLVEVWQTATEYEASIMAPSTRAFRESLLPLSGSSYDERLYHILQ